LFLLLVPALGLGLEPVLAPVLVLEPVLAPVLVPVLVLGPAWHNQQ